VSWKEISPEAVLRAVRAGHATRAGLATAFEVLPTSKFLQDAIEQLVAAGELTDRGGRLVPHDLLEDLTNRDLEGN
jgi:hypothetical protein